MTVFADREAGFRWSCRRCQKIGMNYDTYEVAQMANCVHAQDCHPDTFLTITGQEKKWHVNLILGNGDCYDCGLARKDMADFSVRNPVWLAVQPVPDPYCGTLCANCIGHRGKILDIGFIEGTMFYG